jgi:hypothetical protein
VDNKECVILPQSFVIDDAPVMHHDNADLPEGYQDFSDPTNRLSPIVLDERQTV